MPREGTAGKPHRFRRRRHQHALDALYYCIIIITTIIILTFVSTSVYYVKVLKSLLEIFTFSLEWWKGLYQKFHPSPQSLPLWWNHFPPTLPPPSSNIDHFSYWNLSSTAITFFQPKKSLRTALHIISVPEFTEHCARDDCSTWRWWWSVWLLHMIIIIGVNLLFSYLGRNLVFSVAYSSC